VGVSAFFSVFFLATSSFLGLRGSVLGENHRDRGEHESQASANVINFFIAFLLLGDDLLVWLNDSELDMKYG